MRVLYWADSWWPAVGGIEVLGAQCVRELQRRGFEPLVVTSQCGLELPNEEERDGIRIRRFPFQEALQSGRLDLFAKTRKRIQELKRSWQPEIIHFHFPAPSGIFHMQTSNASAAPLLLAMHTHVPDWKPGPDTLSGKLLRRSTWLTANSAATLGLARSACPEITPHSCVIYNGLLEPALPPAPLPSDPPAVACIGRLVHKKAMDVAIRAMPAVRKKIPGARLLIAGDGPERNDLEHLSNNMGLRDCIEFRGWIAPDKVPAFLNESTIVAIPSRSMEPFGNVAVEAMQMARPVVATNQGGLTEVVVDGETGFLVDPDDPAAIAERIATLAGNMTLASRMGATGQERARLRFSLDRCVEEYISLYRKLAAQIH